jgi:SPP1 family predicted phage head-tail adaptor
MKSRERVEAQAVGNLATHHVYMRFRDDVTPDRRLLWNDNGTDRVLNIESVIDIDNRRVELDIECKEVVQ